MAKKNKTEITENNQENIKEEFENWEDKNNFWFVKLIVFVLIVFLGCYFGYFYVYQNTGHYINTISTFMPTFMESMYPNVISSKEEDIKVSGTLSIGNLAIDNLSLDFSSIASSKDQRLVREFTLKDNKEEIFKANIEKQNEEIFFSVPLLYDGMIKTKNLDNQFLNAIIYLNANDYKYFLENIITYHLEALKDAKLSTHIKGFNTKEYKIVINKENIDKVSRSLKKLIEENERLSKIIDYYHIENYNYMEEVEISLIVKALTNEPISLKVNGDNIDLSASINKNTWDIDFNQEKYTITFNEEEMVIKDTKTNNKIVIGKNGIEFINDNSIMNASDNSIDITYQNGNFKLKVNATKDNDNWDIDGTITYLNKDIDIKGTINIMSGNNLTSVIDSSKAKNLEELSIIDTKKILGNVKELLSKLSLEDLIKIEE